jgi:predicted transcriptional regulator
MRRDKLEIVTDILSVCSGGAYKNDIVRFTRLNSKVIAQYLYPLVAHGMIAEEGEHRKYFHTTYKGRNILNSLEAVRADLLVPLASIQLAEDN